MFFFFTLKVLHNFLVGILEPYTLLYLSFSSKKFSCIPVGLYWDHQINLISMTPTSHKGFVVVL